MTILWELRCTINRMRAVMWGSVGNYSCEISRSHHHSPVFAAFSSLINFTTQTPSLARKAPKIRAKEWKSAFSHLHRGEPDDVAQSRIKSLSHFVFMSSAESIPTFTSKTSQIRRRPKYLIDTCFQKTWSQNHYYPLIPFNTLQYPLIPVLPKRGTGIGRRGRGVQGLCEVLIQLGILIRFPTFLDFVIIFI